MKRMSLKVADVLKKTNSNTMDSNWWNVTRLIKIITLLGTKTCYVLTYKIGSWWQDTDVHHVVSCHCSVCISHLVLPLGLSWLVASATPAVTAHRTFAILRSSESWREECLRHGGNGPHRGHTDVVDVDKWLLRRETNDHDELACNCKWSNRCKHKIDR